jgi:hypothetical protein
MNLVSSRSESYSNVFKLFLPLPMRSNMECIYYLLSAGVFIRLLANVRIIRYAALTLFYLFLNCCPGNGKANKCSRV